MIHTDKPSLSVCAFGAGAAHAAVLALILPVMITLPAPKDEAQGTVAIQVTVRTAPSTPFIQAAMTKTVDLPQAALEGEGDVDEASWAVLDAEDVTGALPEMPDAAGAAEPAPLIEQAALSAPVDAATPAAAVELAPVPEASLVEDASPPVVEEDVTLATVASTETTLSDPSDFMPDVVPRPLRKPALTAVRVEPVAKAAPKPAPRQRVTRSRPQPAPKPFKGIFGGTRATPMEEFPFRAGR